MTPELETIRIAVGGVQDTDTFEHGLFKICATRAPKDYDGFGTFEIHRIDDVPVHRTPMRTVLIKAESEEWQRSRYASGNYGPGEKSEHVSAEQATELFWQAIRNARFTP